VQEQSSCQSHYLFAAMLHMQKITRTQRAIFWIKSRLLIVKRCIENNVIHKNPRLFPCEPPQTPRHTLAEIHTLLYTDTKDTEQEFQLGKIHNLRIASPYFHHIIIPSGATFSFWQQLGRPSKRKGFVIGRELRQGCIIPTIAGGICQLSNSLYQAAKHANCNIIERHAHSQHIEGSSAALGEDATVFWNYIDLRFRPQHTLFLSVFLTSTELVVKLEAC
jgi:vancomycin resistance protein YoaR